MMNAIVWQRPWSILDELELLQDDMNRILSGEGATRSDRGSRLRKAYPPMNVWASEEGLVIDAELPGVDPKDVDISVMGDQLILRGKVNAESVAGETYTRRERQSGEFERTLQLPFRVNTEAVKATCRNGILRLNVSRAEDEKPRRIPIES